MKTSFWTFSFFTVTLTDFGCSFLVVVVLVVAALVVFAGVFFVAVVLVVAALVVFAAVVVFLTFVSI
ncbi:hypothetical protein [Mycoplasmopsis felis]|uniref:hypothetical protein n=1 Tax=Mycoplasmopsis felis TaxID=33923 RepID=UPI003A5C81AC